MPLLFIIQRYRAGPSANLIIMTFYSLIDGFLFGFYFFIIKAHRFIVDDGFVFLLASVFELMK